ncbi:DUF1294 domain-containing protein [Salinispirillum sp. LH 10-3-1]|uniref:DUF1294 domain-containing protein n=1 Tax=Salinispirillum sp. LH 10-3-1 TaxID=2952525 RepID=A0AB38YJN4_9GAMM
MRVGSSFMFAGAFLLVVAVLCAMGFLPVFVLWAYLGISLLTFVIYALDKSAAGSGRRRTPENTLHVLSMIGGWPGALYAQQLLRHKSRKKSFRFVYWLTVLLNLAVLGYLF